MAAAREGFADEPVDWPPDPKIERILERIRVGEGRRLVAGILGRRGPAETRKSCRQNQYGINEDAPKWYAQVNLLSLFSSGSSAAVLLRLSPTWSWEWPTYSS